MWHLGTWSSDGIGSARLTLAQADLKGPSQVKLFYDSRQSSAAKQPHTGVRNSARLQKRA